MTFEPHSIAEIEWREMPAEYRPELEPMLVALLPLLPTWCHEVSVRYDDQGDATKTMATTCEKEYRRVYLWVSPGWLNRSPERRRRTLIHELLHVSQEPLQNLVGDLLMVLKEKSPELEKWLDEQRRYATEEMTCDFTRMVELLLPPVTP